MQRELEAVTWGFSAENCHPARRHGARPASSLGLCIQGQGSHARTRALTEKGGLCLPQSLGVALASPTQWT